VSSPVREIKGAGDLMDDAAGRPDWNRDGRVGPVEGFIGSRTGFARDVLVNVLANLIAAAIIYLGAVAGGLLTAELVPAAVLLLASAAGGLAAGSLVVRDWREGRNRWATVLTVVTAVVLGSLLGWIGIVADWSPWVKASVVAVPAAFAVVIWWVLRRGRH
jgi:hypothetical protein